LQHAGPVQTTWKESIHVIAFGTFCRSLCVKIEHPSKSELMF